jgi:hypothetical protein
LLEKVKWLLFILMLPLVGYSQHEDSVVTRTLDKPFEGQNYYVDNPFGGPDIGNCIKAIRINGEEVKCDLTLNKVTIELHKFKFEIGDQIKIEIDHHFECFPKIVFIDPPYVTPVITSASCTDSMLNWTIENQYMVDKIVIEEFQWGSWEMVGPAPAWDNKLNLNFSKLFTGWNKFRIKVLARNGDEIISKNIEIEISRPLATFTTKDFEGIRSITFSRAVHFKITDLKGKFISSGFGKNVILELSKSRKIYFDNQETEFLKK